VQQTLNRADRGPQRPQGVGWRTAPVGL